VQVRQQTVRDRVGDRGLTECLVPVVDRQLARDDRRAQPDAILDHLEDVGGLRGREGPEQEVVDHEHVDARP
jgi:hypothetical protein